MTTLRSTRSWITRAFALAALLAPATSRADDATLPSRADDAAPNVDAPTSATPPAGDVRRSWMYVEEPTIPAPLHAVVLSRLTYTSTSGASPTRPFAAGVGQPGAMFELGGELGLAEWVSLQATAITSGLGPGTARDLRAGATAGLRFVPFRWEKTKLSASVGYLRELGGESGVWGRASLSHDVGRARFGGTLHAERIFASARDEIDVMVLAGASYAFYGPLRAGLEYVAQDLEGAIDDEEAEGGLRHFAAAGVSVDLLQRAMTLSLGPAVGLSETSPRLLGRVALNYVF